MIIIGTGVLSDAICEMGSYIIFGIGIEHKKIIILMVIPIIPGFKISFFGLRFFLSPLIRIKP